MQLSKEDNTMTQAEKREYLITELLKESPEYENLKIPTNEREQKKLLRSLFNIRMPLPVSDDFIAIQNEYLREETRQKGITNFDDMQTLSNNKCISSLVGEGNTRVYASIYTPGSAETELKPIETDKEWKIIETILEQIQEQVKESTGENEQ